MASSGVADLTYKCDYFLVKHYVIIFQEVFWGRGKDAKSVF